MEKRSGQKNHIKTRIKWHLVISVHLYSHQSTLNHHPLSYERLASSMKVEVAQLCPTFCDPVDYTVHEILQARILEWVAFPFSSGSSRPRNQTRSPALQADSLSAELSGKPIPPL